MIEEVIVVDEKDQEIGRAEKLKAHEEGVLHRAFSIFIFNSQNEMLIHQRAHHKYHSGGLWTNACCSHPRPGEATEDAAHRRMLEELGFDCPLTYLFPLLYRAEVSETLIEHEYDHIYIGRFEGQNIDPNPAEVASLRWISLAALQEETRLHPEHFTAWFLLALPFFKDFA
jgi:isopentenyl-diphosphate Delta-isomerase